MNVIKRDGSIEELDKSKIFNAISKAFKACDYSVDDKTILDMVNDISLWDKISIEDIQDQIEEVLMDWDFPAVAKTFILYREDRNRDREITQEDANFIKAFVKSDNAANTTIDDNSNVGTKGIGVLNAEINKPKIKNTNQHIWEAKIKELYPNFNIKQFRKDINTILYINDFSSQVLEPYCMAVSMYPFLTSGLSKLGGKSAVPKSLESFCGIYVNLVFALASEVKGAVATPEVLLYFDYFARKEWGDDYYKNSDLFITSNICKNKKTILQQIHQYFQQITYSINQIAGSRGMQSPFTNFSFFDKYFFEGMFGDFYFPDGTQPTWESVNWIQKHYLHWLNQERLKCILTFPVCSYACLIDENKQFKDKETFDFICEEYAEGNSFFTYLSNSVDSLSSCCRLQNAVEENTFSFTNGQIGVMTGSKAVITLNLNRIVQDYCSWKWEGIKNIHNSFIEGTIKFSKGEAWEFQEYLKNILERVYKYHIAYNALLHWAKDNHLYAAYDAGFIDLNKQYLTVGINGLNQAAEFLGMKCNKNEEYKDFCKLVFSTIKEQNIKHRTKTERYNCEQIPAESASIKLYNRDKKDGYWVPSDTNLYASYIFKPNDTEISILDKIYLHSSEFAADQLDGGQSAHLNLDSHLSKKQYEKILNYAAKVGCKYLTFNVPNCECEDCGFIAKQPFKVCPKCGSKNVSLWDRIIGYLTKIKNWSAGRQIEQKTRVYSNVNEV